MKIITGMHRSGTSLVAQLFHGAGANLGDEKTFYRPDKWNPDGYFEQTDIHSINFPLINGPFWKLSYFYLPSENTIMKRAERMTGRIFETGKKFHNTVVKETRFCLTLPAWIQSGVPVEKVLICLREPIQVAASLKKRNWISLQRGLELWKIHNLRLLKTVENLPHHFVRYENVLDKNLFPEEAMSSFAFFDMKITAQQCGQLEAAHVKARMNHNRISTKDYPEDIRKLWEHLLKRHAHQSFTK